METSYAGVTPASDIPESVTNPQNKKKNVFKRFWEWYHYQVPFKKLLIVAIGVFILLIIVAGIVYAIIIATGSSKTPVASNNKAAVTPTPTPTPLTKTDVLTGITYTGTQINNLNRPPLAVMIENSIPARPQTGLNQADLVYEALVEGGITRFMGVFLGNTPAMVGPVRSARTYYLDWEQEYDAIYAHWGENSDVLPSLVPDNIRNIDAIVQPGTSDSCASASGIFCRDNSRNAPDNGYGFPAKIWNLASSEGWNSASTITPWTFKADAAIASRGVNKSSLSINFMNSDTDYAVVWTYNQANNDYERANGGAVQYDRADNSTITAKNIVVQFVNGNQYTSAGGKYVWHYNDIGTGKASIFEDGNEVDGTWKKDSTTGRTLFYDESGNPIQFNEGRTWITVLVNNTGSFTYSK